MKQAASNLPARSIGVLLLVGWLSAIPGLLPALLAAVAWFDGSHGVEVSFFNDSVSVVLTHHSDGARCHDAIHHHGLAARLVASFERPDSEGPDHVLAFTGGAGTESPEALHAPDGPVLACLAPWLQPEVRDLKLERVAVEWRGLAQEKPPAHLVEIQSTLLLI